MQTMMTNVETARVSTRFFKNTVYAF